MAYTSNYLIRMMHLAAVEWHWQVGIAAIHAVGFLVLRFSIPRSPRWSASRDSIDEALEVLRLMGESDPEGELAEISPFQVDAGPSVLANRSELHTPLPGVRRIHPSPDHSNSKWTSKFLT